MADNITSRKIYKDEILSNLAGQYTLRVPTVRIITYPVKEKGNIVFDVDTKKLYFSTGLTWELIGAGVGSLSCIQDIDNTTNVCTDTFPETITFTTSGVEVGRFDNNGVFMVNTTIPALGKIAHFEGDIKVTGIVDPTAVQFEEVPDHPVDPTATTTGVLWVRDDGPPNILVYTDNLGTDHDLVPGGSFPLPIFQASVQTTDATPTLLQTIPLGTASRTYLIEVRVTARSGPGLIGASYMLEGTYKRDAGNLVTSIGMLFRRESRDDPNWTVGLNVGVSSVDVIVTGVILTTIEWNVVTILQISD